ncbi:alpha/beta hydrolase [Zeaxanthinibacter sp. PT1]|uniref:dienelactone hydrolase family protein n=1 Tax=Zeaxanthinibacter TaxID=561554 RepID=UPI00234B1207|nr:alpha/beta hydrolase [Zeaxanthinibacter sp. PT1]MDC6352105.1 alpha/beta hydrolase [Zeaxanthinibacter sp. PT1]
MKISRKKTRRRPVHSKNTHNIISIPVGGKTLKGILAIPENPRGIVLFSHGSGSGRFSPRNNHVANHLRKNELATLLFDLLTAEEDQNYYMRFNIDLLSSRLIAVSRWIMGLESMKDIPIGYFGSSTGSASALRAAAFFGDQVSAVVSRGGRPDMAMEVLPSVLAPTLLIVGELDQTVLGLNQRAYSNLNCIKKLEVIPGASHLFGEKGKLDIVVDLANNWFSEHMNPNPY